MIFVQSDPCKQFHGLVFVVIAPEPLKCHEILQRGQVFGKALPGEQKSDLAPGGPEFLRRGCAQQCDAAGVRGDQSGQNPEQCGFSCAIVAYEAVDMAGFQGEGHVIQRLLFAIAFRNVVDDQYVHGAPPFRQDPGGEFESDPPDNQVPW